MGLKKLLPWIAAAAVIIAGFVWALRPQPVLVDTATVGRGDVVLTVMDEGIARIEEVYTVSAPLAGRVLRTPLDPGDRVVRHETIVATIEPTPPGFLDVRSRRELQALVDSARSALVLAEAEVKSAEAEVTFWQAELKRQSQLRARDTISERALEQAQLQLSIREAQLDTANAAVLVRKGELQRAEALLIEPEEQTIESHSPCCLHVRSPADGRVLDVLVESETVVRAGEPILTVGDRRGMEVMVELLSDDAVLIEAGAPAVIERWGGPDLDARVLRIEPAGFEEVSALGIDEQRVRVRLEITSPPEMWRRLGHEFRVYARIVADRHDEVLTVPVSALFREKGDWAVFAIEDGRAVIRPIDLGAMNDHVAEVIGGLNEGVVVVVHPSDRVEDGGRVADRAAL